MTGQRAETAHHRESGHARTTGADPDPVLAALSGHAAGSTPRSSSRRSSAAPTSSTATWRASTARPCSAASWTRSPTRSSSRRRSCRRSTCTGCRRGWWRCCSCASSSSPRRAPRTSGATCSSSRRTWRATRRGCRCAASACSCCCRRRRRRSWTGSSARSRCCRSSATSALRFVARRRWKGAGWFAISFAALLLIHRSFGGHVLAIALMYFIVAITYASGLGYLFGVGKLHGRGRIDRRRPRAPDDVDRAARSSPSARSRAPIRRRGRSSRWSSFELAHGGLDNLLAHHHAEDGARPLGRAPRRRVRAAPRRVARRRRRRCRALRLRRARRRRRRLVIAFVQKRRYYLDEKPRAVSDRRESRRRTVVSRHRSRLTRCGTRVLASSVSGRVSESEVLRGCILSDR